MVWKEWKCSMFNILRTNSHGYHWMWVEVRKSHTKWKWENEHLPLSRVWIHKVQKINRTISNDYVQLHGYYGSIKCCIFGICLVVFVLVVYLFRFTSHFYYSHHLTTNVDVYGVCRCHLSMWWLQSGADIAQLPRAGVSGAHHNRNSNGINISRLHHCH